MQGAAAHIDFSRAGSAILFSQVLLAFAPPQVCLHFEVKLWYMMEGII